MRRRVVFGLSETIATLPPQRAFTSVDLPTFGLPATAMKPLLISGRLDRERGGIRRRPRPNQGWGCLPATHTVERTERRRTRSRQICAKSLHAARASASRVQIPRLRKEFGRRVRHDLPRTVRERHTIETELPQPLPAAAARRRGDADRLEVTRPTALGDRPRDRRLLGANSERVRSVLDIHTLERPPVARENHGTDEVIRVRRVRPPRRRARPLDEFLARHANTWNKASVISAPSTPPYATSSVEWTPASTRVCATSSAMMNVSVEMRNRCSWSLRTYVAAIQPANAIAACPDGSPPRSGVPRPLIAFVAITTRITTTSEMSVSFAGASRSLSNTRSLRFATCPENTR